MQDKIKAQLKALGLDEALAEKIKAEKEEDIPKAIIKYQVDSEADRRVTEALKTREKKLREDFDLELKAKLEELEKKTEKKPEPKDVDILKSIQETLKPFTDKIEKLEQVENKRNRDFNVKKLLKESNLDESSWFDKVTAESDDDIKKQVEDIKGLVTKIRQEETDKLLKDGTFKRSSGGPVESGVIAKLIETNSKGPPGSDKIGVVDTLIKKG